MRGWQTDHTDEVEKHDCLNEVLERRWPTAAQQASRAHSCLTQLDSLAVQTFSQAACLSHVAHFAMCNTHQVHM